MFNCSFSDSIVKTVGRCPRQYAFLARNVLVVAGRNIPAALNKYIQ